jgi:hypothetical protein
MLKRHPKQARRGVILIVVLMLLTLFAIIGVSFVLYADSEASSARLDREAKALSRPDMDPTQALSLMLGQVLYGVDDANGLYSGIRGYDLARGIYGGNTIYDPTSGLYYALGNSTPFTGNGRLQYAYPSPLYPTAPALAGQQDWPLVNYTYFFPQTKLPSDNFIRDPDRYQARNTLLQAGLPDPRQTYVGASGAPYTYPDHNNFYLGVIRASDGAVLAQSFHRPYMGFGTLDPKSGYNAATGFTNWTIPSVGPVSDPLMKYKVLRPRPAEHPNFPPPEDAGGDVKNFLGGPGYWDPIQQKFCNNDSFWVDPGLPPMTGPDGKPFKMLAAMLIVDLGGRVDVNAHGNVRGTSGDHRSVQGWGPWEVSLKPVLNSTSNTSEWVNLFTGRVNNNDPSKPIEVLGKYGYNANQPTNPIPAPAGAAGGGNWAHYYAPVDYEACQSTGQQSGQWFPAPPTVGVGAGVFGTATLPRGYRNGSQAERTNHPMIYNMSQPYPTPSSQVTTAAGAISSWNLRFPASDMERLCRFSDTDGPSLASQLERLCPLNFNNPSETAATANLLAPPAKRRLLVTTDSGDRNFPGFAPYLNPSAAGSYAINFAGGQTIPQGSGQPFPTLPTLPVGSPNEFGNGWRAQVWQQAVPVALQRINLNRTLTPYPLYPKGAPTTPPQQQSTYAIRFDDPNLTAVQQQQFAQAQVDRQVLANDIYRTLVALTGAPTPSNQTNPLAGLADQQVLAVRRYLAQIAVNIVDFIDEDDIMTPFNFYNPVDDKLDPGQINAKAPDIAGPPTVPAYWVFGTELPHVLLNEALAEHGTVNAAGTLEPVKVWAELYNPFQTYVSDPVNNPLQNQDAYAVPLWIDKTTAAGSQPYAPYQLVVSTTIAPSGVDDNATGAPAFVLMQTTADDFKALAPLVKDGTTPQAAAPGLAANAANIPASSYFLLGPQPLAGADTTMFRDPFLGSKVNAPNTPAVRSNNLSASVTPAPINTSGVAVLLQRLANPHLPFDATTNPYVTVDYLTSVPVRAMTDTTYASRSKRQPYGALTKLGAFPAVTADSPVQDAGGPVDTNSNVQHSFGQANNPSTTPADWLVHLDRQVISPMELLHVSGSKPHMLTQNFVTRDNGTAAGRTSFQHRAPWFDEGVTPPGSRRLYRLFEFLDTNNRAGTDNNPRAGRHTGKININAIWDFETFQALCDTQYNGTAGTGPNRFKTTDVQTIWNQILQSRSNGTANGLAGVPGPVNVSAAYINALNAPYAPQTPYQLNHPFLGLATGFSAAGGDTQNPNGQGLSETLLRQSMSAPGTLLMEPNPTKTHPYERFELLTKIFNNVTVRSNVFAVWITVGFFDYSTGTLGPEIGRAEGRNVRHRMFAIVDRSNSIAFNTTTKGITTVTAPTGTSGTSPSYGLQSVNLNTAGVPNDPNPPPFNTQVVNNPNTGMNWAIGSRTQSLVQPLVLVYDPGDPAFEEVVVAVPVQVPIPGPGGGQYYQLQAAFRKTHNANAQVVCCGNPGPWIRPYDPRQDTGLVLTSLSNNRTVVLPGPVLHYSIIE